MKYKSFSIPFSTAPKSSYKIQGFAYYVINENFEIIKQFIQITKANYRPTDCEMLNTSYYKNNDEYIKIRKIFLEKINPKIISKKDKIRNNLSQNEIDNINVYLLKLSRVKRSVDIFTGSNSSGAESFPLKSEIIYSDKNDKNLWCNGMNFSNPLNNFLIKNYKKISKAIKITSISKDLEVIEFCELINNDNFIKIKDTLKKYNSFIFFQKEKKLEDITSFDNDIFLNLKKDILEEINLYENKSKYKYNESDYYSNSVKKNIDEFKEEIISEISLEQRLRFIQKILIHKELSNIQEKTNDNSWNFLENDVICNFIKEHAHIISVKYCKKNNKYDWIADPNNCILMSPTIHKLFDKNIITFNNKGISILNGKEHEWKIREIFLNDQRERFLSLNYKYFNENNNNT